MNKKVGEGYETPEAQVFLWGTADIITSSGDGDTIEDTWREIPGSTNIVESIFE